MIDLSYIYILFILWNIIFEIVLVKKKRFESEFFDD